MGPAGVVAREDLGFRLTLGLDEAWRKSSGISFQLSMLDMPGTGADETRVGAETDLEGGGGRLGLESGVGGGGGGGSVGVCIFGCFGCGAGFCSQLEREDCIVVVEEKWWV